MLRGLYTAALGMLNNEKRMEVVANNIANVNTNGYKKDIVVTSSFSEVMTKVINSTPENKIGTLALGVGVDDVVTNYKQGSIMRTDNPLDVALKNSDLAFFCIEVPDENGVKEMYTRDGAFTINSQGQLTTKDGYIVKGEKGPITLKGGSISINPDGTILENGKVVDKLLIKEFVNSENLRKHGNNLIIDTNNSATKDFSGEVIQGSLETSNVNSISEMIEMINIMRNYEANQKVLRSFDDTLQKAVNEIGKV